MHPVRLGLWEPSRVRLCPLASLSLVLYSYDSLLFARYGFKRRCSEARLGPTRLPEQDSGLHELLAGFWAAAMSADSVMTDLERLWRTVVGARESLVGHVVPHREMCRVRAAICSGRACQTWVAIFIPATSQGA